MAAGVVRLRAEGVPVGVADHELEDFHEGERRLLHLGRNDLRHLEQVPPVAAGHRLVILEEEGVLGHRVPPPLGVDIGDLRETHPEAQVGEETVRAVDQVLLQHVLLVLLPTVLAVRHQLQLVLAREDRVLELSLFEVEAQIGKAADTPL